MSGPFSNSTDGELFTANRCDRCVHTTVDGDPCDDFTPAYLGEWPEILYRSPDGPSGVECRKFEALP
jgi:hypothetical protein